jgi:hypothetical protein
MNNMRWQTQSCSVQARPGWLRLNTSGFMCTQPGFRARRRRYGEFPSRDKWIEYLEDYTEHHQLEVRFGTKVKHVAPANGGWRVRTDRGELHARFVVIATGYDSEPNLPAWPGRDGFTGELIHSSDYRNPEPYVGRDVLVVGPGTTGSEIATLLSQGGAGRVRVACRTPPNVITRKILGASVNAHGIVLNHVPIPVADKVTWRLQRNLFGDLEPYGIPRSPYGIATATFKRQQTPVYDSGFVRLLKSGEIKIVPAVLGFDSSDVLLADGTRIQPDAVIAATGYRRGLEGLVGHLGVLDENGIPLTSGGKEHPSAPGLFFNGFRTNLSGQLRLMRPDARAIARAVKRQKGTRG